MSCVKVIKTVAVKVSPPRGFTGKSAYEFAVENGFTGTEQEWIDSVESARLNAEQSAIDAQSSADDAQQIVDSLDKSSVGLGNVDNTSDLSKPVSTATQSALDDKVDKVSVTDNLNSNSPDNPLSANQGLILKGFIDNINNILTSDDTNLDELQEIVDFIKINREDLNTLGISSISGLESALNDKVDKISGKGLSAEDYTTNEKNKLANIEEGAQINVGTDLGVVATGSSRLITSSTGSNATINYAASDLGLGNVDNTSDLSKPISTATQTALDLKADASTIGDIGAILDSINGEVA